MPTLNAYSPLLVPFFADQPFRSEQVVRLGVGPIPLPRRRLTAERLARAIEAATAPNTWARAADVGRFIAAEDGVGVAVAHFEQALRAPQITRPATGHRLPD